MNMFAPLAFAPRELRDYQKTAIDMVRGSLRSGHRRPLLQLPCGAGKTRIAAAIVSGALEKGNKAIFVVPRLSLIEQTVKSFETEGIVHIGVIQGANFRTDGTASIQIASAQTLARRDIPRAAICIIDECHLRSKAISTWISDPEWERVPFIGLSATPWSKGLGQDFDDLLKPISISELIARGFLSPFKIFSPPAPDLETVRTVAGDFREDDLSNAVDRREIVADVIRTWFERGENRPTLVYAVDRAHAAHLQERFIEAGVSAEYLDGESPMFEREETFDRFRSGETKVICNVQVLDTGLDLDVRCICDCRPTKSRIRFVQTLGRAIRTAEGKIDAIFLDHGGNHLRLGLITDIDCDHLHDGKAQDKKSYDKEPAKDGDRPPRTCKECHYVLEPRVRTCPQCGAAQGGPTDVIERAGELVELGSKAKQTKLNLDVPRAIKQAWWSGIMGYMLEKGKSPQWAAHTYRAKFGTWPNKLGHVDPLMPTVDVRNFIKMRAIAWAKAQDKFKADKG